MVSLMDKKHKLTKQGITLIAIGLFITVCFMPTIQGEKDFQQYDEYENQKSKSLYGCYFLICGRICNPRIEEKGKYKWLWIHAEAVYVNGFGVSYDGMYGITQWIYSDDVKLTWEGHDPKFRGLITNNFIFGIQRARFF